ncbi:MAG: PAS domain S-box protein, partial [Rhodocyclaceae bacterium]
MIKIIPEPATRISADAANGYISEVRRQESLLITGALQSAIFNSANFSSIATDAKGVIQIFNVGAERMLGYTATDVMNKVTPADISDPQEVIARAKALSVELDTPITPGFEALVFKASRGIEDIYELTYIRKDGSRFPAVVSVTALRDDQDMIIGYLLIGTDNTARKQIESDQQELAQRLRDYQFYTRSLFESNIDALVTTDLLGIVTDVNKQMEVLTGCTRDELVGAPFRKHFTDQERAGAGIRLVLGEGKVTNYELTAQNRGGKETVVSCNATTIYDRDRKLQGVFAAARDITERKKLEIDLVQRKSELRELYVSLRTLGEAERHRFARELHDNLGHLITALSMDLGWIEANLPPLEPPVAARLGAIAKQIAQIVDANRNLIEDLRPEMLDPLGLGIAIENYVTKFCARTGIRGEFVMDPSELVVGENISISIFRIVQEALSNVSKHANATKVSTRLTKGANNLVLI